MNLVADGSRAQHGSFTAGLCLDSLIGEPAPDTRWRHGSSAGSEDSEVDLLLVDFAMDDQVLH